MSVDQLVNELDSLKRINSRVADTDTSTSADADADDYATATFATDHEGYTGLLSRPLPLSTSGMPTLPPPLLLPSLNNDMMFPLRRTSNLLPQPPQVLIPQTQPHKLPSTGISLPSFDELEALTSKLVADNLGAASQAR